MTTIPPISSSPIVEALRARRTVRRFRDDGVPPAVLAEMIDVACWAPSPHHTQPWRFVAVERGARRERMARALGERWRADLRRDGEPDQRIEGRLRRSYDKIAGAPALIIPCLVPGVLDSYPDPRRQAAELSMGAHSLGAAIQSLLLAAYTRGLGAYWMCAPVFCPDVVVEALSLDQAWRPQAFILIGYPAEVLPPHSPTDLDRMMVWR
ncbi:MAG: nitroreductase family protein [Chloroflexota bacterium]